MSAARYLLVGEIGWVVREGKLPVRALHGGVRSKRGASHYALTYRNDADSGVGNFVVVEEFLRKDQLHGL